MPHHNGVTDTKSLTLTETTMGTDLILSEIKDANLRYLLLTQQMIRDDLDAAMFRLGISKKIADIIASLSTSQTIKLASSPNMLMRFRFDDATILGMLTHDTKEIAQAHAHASILLAAQPAVEMH